MTLKVKAFPEYSKTCVKDSWGHIILIPQIRGSSSPFTDVLLIHLQMQKSQPKLNVRGRVILMRNFAVLLLRW